MVIFLHTQNDIPMPLTISQFLKENKKILKKYHNDKGKLDKRFVSQIKEGDFNAIEDIQFLKVLKEKGYDSFTTFEREGTNIMLFNPKKQFVPLFDQKKTSKLGYKKGGSMIQRNPNPYKPKAI